MEQESMHQAEGEQTLENPAKEAEMAEAKKPYQELAKKLRGLADEFEQKSEAVGRESAEEFEERQAILVEEAKLTFDKVAQSQRLLIRGEGGKYGDHYALSTPQEAYGKGLSNDRVDQEYRELIFGAYGLDAEKMAALKKDALERYKKESIFPRYFKTNQENVYGTIWCASPIAEPTDGIAVKENVSQVEEL